MLKWEQVMHSGRKHECETDEAIRHIVDAAPDYHAGAVETLAARHDKLLQIVGCMLAHLPDTVQREVMETYGYPFKEVK